MAEHDTELDISSKVNKGWLLIKNRNCGLDVLVLTVLQSKSFGHIFMSSR